MPAMIASEVKILKIQLKYSLGYWLILISSLLYPPSTSYAPRTEARSYMLNLFSCNS